MTGQQIDDLVEVSAVQQSDERTLCPLCLISGPFSSGLDNHIADHLERIATFAFPRPILEAGRLVVGSNCPQESFTASKDMLSSIALEFSEESTVEEGYSSEVDVVGQACYEEDGTEPSQRRSQDELDASEQVDGGRMERYDPRKHVDIRESANVAPMGGEDEFHKKVNLFDRQYQKYSLEKRIYCIPIDRVRTVRLDIHPLITHYFKFSKSALIS